MKRRDLIRHLVAGGVVGGVSGVAGLGCVAGSNGTGPGGPQAVTNGRRRGGDGPVRNIIFFAYDGFNFEDLAAARYFAGLRGAGQLELERLMGAGAAGSMLTHSLTSVVTDSAAASSAWATGRKVINGALSMYPDGRDLITILDLARDAGKATGLITTTRLTHATPAGWGSKVPVREMEDEVAEQYLARRVDVLLGGGRLHFAADLRADGRDLEAEFRVEGYRVVRSAAELAGLRDERVLGVFTDDHLPFEIDRRFQGVAAPSLAAITRAGLSVLDRRANGFVVQIEAGRIDHANHHNDPGGSVWDVLAADEALAVARAYADANPDTLLIMASDHATGGQALYGLGARYGHSTPALETLGRRRASHEYLRSHVLGEGASAGRVRSVVAEYLGVDLTGAQADQVARVLAREVRAGHRNAHRDEPLNSFYQVISTGPGAPDRPNINFATGAHTAGLVPLIAYGAWDGPANLGVVDNTELFGWMTRALGAEFHNPTMSAAEAQRLSAAAPEREMVLM
jgi:alkaline phosphatase